MPATTGVCRRDAVPPPEISGIVDELRRSSPEFVDLWSSHPARERPLGQDRLDHQVFGELILGDTVLRPVERDDQALFVFHPDPGSDSERHLSRYLDAPAGPGT